MQCGCEAGTQHSAPVGTHVVYGGPAANKRLPCRTCVSPFTSCL